MTYFSCTCIGAELHDLVNEVNDWIPFGLYFGVEISILEAIEKECTTFGEHCNWMLNAWQKQVTSTLPAVIKALLGIGMKHLASWLARKHG